MNSVPQRRPEYRLWDPGKEGGKPEESASHIRSRQLLFGGFAPHTLSTIRGRGSDPTPRRMPHDQYRAVPPSSRLGPTVPRTMRRDAVLH